MNGLMNERRWLQMNEFLTSGKFLTGVLAIGLFVLACAPLLGGDTVPVLIRGIAFVGLFCFFALSMVWQKRAFSDLKKSDRATVQMIQALDARNRELEGAVASLRQEINEQVPETIEAVEKNIMVSLGRIGRAQVEIESKLEKQNNAIPKKTVEVLQKDYENRLLMQSDPVGQKSIYNLSSVPPMKVVKSNTSGALGRSAAMIEVDGDSTEPLRRMQKTPSETWRPNVATIVRRELNRAIADSNNVVEVPPNQAEANASRSLDFVVVDESAFTVGGWSGALETYKLQTFMDLELFIKKSKKNGAVIIVIESNTNYAMTNSLRDMADVLIYSDGVAREHNGNMINLELCQTIIAATNSEKE